MGVNKVVYGNTTLVDMTMTTVTPETLLKGATALNKAGELIKGTAGITAADDGAGNVAIAFIGAAVAASGDGIVTIA